MSFSTTLETFFDKYIFEPLFDEGMSELYQDSILQDIVEYPVLSADFRGGYGAEPTTLGSVAKDFATGFLNIGEGEGGSGIYKSGPYQAPPVKKIKASPSRIGSELGAFRPTEVNLASNYGVTNGVKANLYKATLSDVPQIRDIVTQLTKSANRRSGVKNRLGSTTLKGVKKRTSMPYTTKPKYFG